MRTLKTHGKGTQARIAITLRFQFGYRREDIVPVRARSAVTLTNQMDLALQSQTTCILRVAAIDDVNECHNDTL